MTRIWLISDVHQEFLRDPQYGRHPETIFDPDLDPPSDVDVVVLAGDIDVTLPRSIRWAAERFGGLPVIYVPGNHDFYSSPSSPGTLGEILDAGREEASRCGVHLLSDDTVVIEGTRFIGATLWTDFGIGAGNLRYKCARAAGREGMSDYRHIRRWSSTTPGKRKRFRPEDSIALHRQSRRYIESVLAMPFDGPTVVVTHHAPARESLRLAGREDLDWCYASDLSAMMTGPTAPEAWLHGHIHRAQDYVVGATRVVANPRGYRFAGELDHGWDPALVVEIGEDYAPKPPRW